jgi:hypothetical protein
VNCDCPVAGSGVFLLLIRRMREMRKRERRETEGGKGRKITVTHPQCLWRSGNKITWALAQMRFLFIVWIWELKSKSKTKRSVLEKKSVDIFEIFQIATTCCSSVGRDLGKEGQRGKWEGGGRGKCSSSNKRRETRDTTSSHLKDNIEWRAWAMIDGTCISSTSFGFFLSSISLSLPLSLKSSTSASDTILKWNWFPVPSTRSLGRRAGLVVRMGTS